MKRNARYLPLVLLTAAAVAACGSSDDSDPVPPSAASDAGASNGSGTDVLAGFSSCADVAPAVAQYIEGLQEAESNSVDEYGAYCNWETPDDATNLSEIRGVEVIVEPGSGEVPRVQDLEAGKLVVLPDADLEEIGGVAYTLPMTTAVAGVVATTVETPDVRVSITGGQWNDAPSLDAPAAVAAAKQLIGVPA